MRIGLLGVALLSGVLATWNAGAQEPGQAAPPPGRTAAEQPRMGLITVHAVAHRRLPSTVSDASVSIEVHGRDLRGTATQLGHQAQALLGYLRSQSAERLRTDGTSFDPEIQEQRGQPDRIKGYTGKVSISFRTKPEQLAVRPCRMPGQRGYGTGAVRLLPARGRGRRRAPRPRGGGHPCCGGPSAGGGGSGRPDGGRYRACRGRPAAGDGCRRGRRPVRVGPRQAGCGCEASIPRRADRVGGRRFRHLGDRRHDRARGPVRIAARATIAVLRQVSAKHRSASPCGSPPDWPEKHDR